MKLPAIAVIVFAALIGLAAGFGLRATGDNPLAADNQSGTGAEKLPAAEKIEALPFYNPSSSDTKTTSESADTQSSDNAPANLTEKLAGDFAADFFRRNPEGPVNINGGWMASVPLEADVSQMLSESYALFKKNEERENDLSDNSVIITENSEEAYQNYLTTIHDIFRKFNLNQKGRDTNAFFEQVKIMERLVADFQKIPVPSDFQDVHKELRKLLIMEKNAMVAIASADNDPLQAAIAMNILSQFDVEAEKISEKIQAIVNKNAN